MALGLGAPLGFLAFRTDLPGRRWLLAGALLAACLPPFITVASWLAFLGTGFWFTLGSATARTLAAAWLQGLTYVPLATLVCGLAAASVPRGLEETALLERPPAAVFWRITVPQAAWGAAAAAGMVAVLAFGDISVTDLLLVRTFAEETYTQFQHRGEPWPAAALAVPVLALTALLAAGVAAAWRGHAVAGLAALRFRRPRRLAMGWARWPLAAVALAVVAAAFLLPLGALLQATRGPAQFVTAIQGSTRELVYTLTIAPVAALVATGLGLGAAWGWTRRPATRWVLAPALLLLLTLPAPVYGVGLSLLLNHPGPPGWMYDSRAVLVWAGAARALPFATLVLLPALGRLPAAFEDLAALEGAGWWRRLALVVAPALWRWLLAAWLLGLVLALGELGASVLVAPPGDTTLSIRLATLLHMGVYPDVAGLCVLLLAGVLVPTAALALLAWRAFARCLA